MNQHASRYASVFLITFLISTSAANRAAAAGSPDTRLIAIGFNFLLGAPITPGHLFEIDKQTGALTPIGAPFTMEADNIGANLAGNSSDKLFNVFGELSDPRVNQLTLSGDVAQFVPFSDGTPFGPFVYVIGFDSQDRLHGILLNGNPVSDAPPTLSEINTSTGLATTIEILSSADYTSMAFNAQDNLYAVAENLGLLRIDTSSGDLTVIGGDLATRSSGDISRRPIVFDRDGTMFVAADQLRIMDPATGNTTAVGSESFGFPYSLVGLAVIAIPEPGTLGMLAVAALVMGLARNYR